MVLGPDRKGLKVTYCTDTRPVPVIAEYADHADLFICEGMYGEDGKEAKGEGVQAHGHGRGSKPGLKKAQPAEMWLTHFSPSLNRPDEVY